MWKAKILLLFALLTVVGGCRAFGDAFVDSLFDTDDDDRPRSRPRGC